MINTGMMALERPPMGAIRVTAMAALTAVPVAVFEFSLCIRLAVKGFGSLHLTAGM